MRLGTAIAILLFLTGCWLKKEAPPQPATTNNSPSGKIVLEGRFDGRNIYIQNPFAPNGVGFCVTQALVNGEEVKDVASSAFEIPLRSMGFKKGDSLHVELIHGGGCMPKVLNPEPAPRISTFDIVSISIDTSGLLNWKTKNEEARLPFIVEQFRWNKWVKVGEVDGIGGPEENHYSFKVKLHSHMNSVRVKQVDYRNQPHISKTVQVDAGGAICEIGPRKIETEVTFSSETAYEVYDSHGNMLKRGFGKTIDCRKLPRGAYYLNYDNQTTEFIKR